MTSQQVTSVASEHATLDRRATAIGAALLTAVVSALFFYKWGGSLRELRRVEATEALAIRPDLLLGGGVLLSTAHYFQRIWPALIYGILIGSIVRSAVSPAWIVSRLGRRGRMSSLTGAALGSPLMLCSCCVTPVFTGVVQRGAGLGPALSLMLASPALNPAALALTFLLLPLRYGLLRLAAALVIVLALGPAVGARFAGTVRAPRPPEEDLSPIPLRSLLTRFVGSVAYMVGVTVPLIVVGTLASASLLPRAVHLGTYQSAAALMMAALIAMLVALPTFFEIPLALLLLQLAAPPGAAVALLVAGPVVNLPSLLVLSREAGIRVAAAVAAGVWLTACVAGIAASG
jgi:uncharacterized membrane protein YraQ (UPF0718 family)